MQRLMPVRGLLALALCLPGLAAAADAQLDYFGSFQWPTAEHRSGGFSAIEVSDDGQRFTAVSDRGPITFGQFIRDPDTGRIAGITATKPEMLRDTSGKLHPKERYDPEGLAVSSSGRLYVSFEGLNLIWGYDSPRKAVETLTSPAFKRLQSNSGLEALAMDPQGRLVAIPERSGALNRPFPVWRLENGTWHHRFDLPRSGGFLMVGADFGPDGKLYTLERVFSGWGFRSRIRRFSFEENRITADETLLETGLWQHDNLEGIATWRDPSGAIRLTMISDDNFNAVLKTNVVEYRVVE
ncbi:esterase-like activity of phytase family protein [Primorskyibacter sp. 2E107]|uniref:esterase-like activity of phytase family protein n=1 Tax=Primorskyibacter sp. 2E107 TaxID=3403458 RepID=UPI003AF8874A